MEIKKKYFLGIDPSLNCTGWAVISIKDGKVSIEAKGHIKQKPKENAPQQLRNIRQQLLTLKKFPLEKTIVVEKPFHRNNQSTAALFEVHGVIHEAFAEFDFLTIPSVTMRKNIGGHGKATKEMVEKGVREILVLPDTVEFETNDESDAVGNLLCFLLDRGYLSPALQAS